MPGGLTALHSNERYFDCMGHEILPRCKDNEIILRDADNYPNCIAVAPPPSTQELPLLALALIIGIIAGNTFGLWKGRT